MKKLFLIDGNSFCYRAYYAIKELSNSKGQPTNAVYGFITMLNKLIKDNVPDYLAVSFDLKHPTFRHKKYQEYKIHRKPMPEDLVGQLPIIKDVLTAYNIPIYEKEGFEADDILATIAKKIQEKGIDVYIVTGDKDALQLVGSHIKVYSPHKEDLIYDIDKVKARYGVEPQRMLDIMALMGDASDNIPGVPGIGEKTATELILEFGTLEGLLKNIDKIKSGTRKQLLTEYAKQAVLSKELAMLDMDVPIEFSLKDLELKQPDNSKLLQIFKELEFRTLINQLEVKDDWEAEYKLIKNINEFQDLVDRLKRQKEFAFDFETTGSDAMDCKIVGVSFCWKEKEAVYVPVLGKLAIPGALETLKPVFEDENLKKIGQNIKYEMVVLSNYDIRLEGVTFDTMVASYLLNPSKLNHNLNDISLEYLSHKMTPIEDLIGKGKDEITMDKVDVDKVTRYCCEDSDATFRLKNILEKQLKKRDLYELFSKIEIPLIYVLAGMEQNGVCIDTALLNKMSVQMQDSLDKLTKEIYQIAGMEFNINSPKQLSEILFEKMKLPVVKKTKTGISTDVEVLEKLALVHALPATLLRYRELMKLKSTYVDALPRLINKNTQKVHTSFNQTVTQTGRLSSSDPNLQNIPIKTPDGKRIRAAFIPCNKNNLILSADYSQIELRILAHLSGDSQLQDAFKKGLDIHRHTASLVFGVAEDNVTPDMRDTAKTVNFGIIYGMSPYGLSKELNIEPERAREFIDAYFSRYPQVKSYLEFQIEFAKKYGYVVTILNRRRYIPQINSQNMTVRQFAERTSINTPIQGSAADLIKMAMIKICDEIEDKKLKSKMILQVHDELVFDVPKNEQDVLSGLVKNHMENVIKLKVPINVGIKTGKNWMET